MCKLALPRTIVCFIKIIFRGCPIIHSLSNRVVGETMNSPYKIKVVGDWFFLFGKNLFSKPEEIYSDRT